MAGWKERAINQFRKLLTSEQAETATHLIVAVEPFSGSASEFRRIAQAKESQAVLDYWQKSSLPLSSRG